MNERIKELAEQATQEFSPAFERDKWQEKFAELIARECITVVGKTPLGYRDYRNQIEEDMRSACVDSLKEHFRVEE
jgi:hypothetical protein